MEPRCAPLLSVMAFAIPCTSVHACICGYYYGKEKVSVPAAAQLFEQTIRIFTVFLLVSVCIEKQIPVIYAYQELDALPEGYEVTEGRTKPWGTGQAVLTVKGLIDCPFLVINADDYYGKKGFCKIHEYMVNEMKEDGDVYDICMGGFILKNTLSDNGAVTRGVCEEENGILKKVTETYNIRMMEDGLHASDDAGNPVKVLPEQLVSMNMWGLPVSFLNELEKGFPEFLDNLKPGDIKAEYLLPKIIDQLVHEGKAKVRVLDTPDKWFGVTYKEDKQAVVDAIRGLISAGVYKEKLFD